MGWNSGYTIFEATVVGAYDLGLLSKDLLCVLMEPYRGSDIDSGGSHDLVAKDGLDVKEIVVKTWGKKLPKKPEMKASNQEAVDRYYDRISDQFYKITDQFDWR